MIGDGAALQLCTNGNGRPASVIWPFWWLKRGLDARMSKANKHIKDHRFQLVRGAMINLSPDHRLVSRASLLCFVFDSRRAFYRHVGVLFNHVLTKAEILFGTAEPTIDFVVMHGN